MKNLIYNNLIMLAFLIYAYSLIKPALQKLIQSLKNYVQSFKQKN